MHIRISPVTRHAATAIANVSANAAAIPPTGALANPHVEIAFRQHGKRRGQTDAVADAALLGGGDGPDGWQRRKPTPMVLPMAPGKATTLAVTPKTISHSS